MTLEAVVLTVPFWSGERKVVGYRVPGVPGLAVASLDPNPRKHEYVVTHIASGRSIGPAGLSRKAALANGQKLAGVVDWTQPAAQLTDPGSRGVELAIRVQEALQTRRP